ncbi:hypothetical protein [Streptomyces chilikensis]|uniref:hypothetical protein n=1 Tax=Streptomyces chilikensis TaxID=1194079 RepID=UPI001F0E3DF0|nr:hypothetical protein [Streptomyces chilikensis]
MLEGIDEQNGSRLPRDGTYGTRERIGGRRRGPPVDPYDGAACGTGLQREPAQEHRLARALRTVQVENAGGAGCSVQRCAEEVELTPASEE